MSSYKTARSGMYIKFRGEAYQVTGHSDGKVIYARTVEPEKCQHCGAIQEPREHAWVEDSPLFQEHAEPVDTLHEALPSVGGLDE